MVVTYLIPRLASDDQHYREYLRSAHSLVFAPGATTAEFEIGLSVGGSVALSHPARGEKFVSIDDEGFVLRPGAAVTVETKEMISVPLNLFGVIFPKGTLAHRHGIMIPTTKVDPGFSGTLRLLLVNHSKQAKEFKIGEAIGSLVLIATNRTVPSPIVAPHPRIEGRPVRWSHGAASFFERRKGLFYGAIVPLIAAVVGALIALQLGD